MNIKILGAGCKKCKSLEGNVLSAAENLGLSVEIEKITDAVEIAGYGVMSTPGLVIDDKLVSSGRVLNINEMKEVFQAQI
ncbi:MAG: thioredoxin family protein [Cocleimonas sp.]